MWRDYSKSYIRNNRASTVSIIAAAFIASLFLSFLCGLFYNFWQDEIRGIMLEEGGWQGRIIGEISAEDLLAIRSHADVEEAVVNEAWSEGQRTAVDLKFFHPKRIVQDMMELLELTGLPEDAGMYHYQLLSMYFIRIPGDEMPRMMMPLYLLIVLLVSLSMVLIIGHAFGVSMDSRIRQFGILSSIGATPKQIRFCLMQEAAALAMGPVLAGILCGTALCGGVLYAMGQMAAEIAGGRSVRFQYHPMLLVLTLSIILFTVFFSAWLPAWKLSRITPLEAIRQTGELQLKKKKSSRILSALFGVEGELAGNSLKAQKKALRTSSLALTFSFLGFTLMQCLFTLSEISTDHTYFERYQDTWDVMLTVEDTEIGDFSQEESLKALPGARSTVIYQKKEAVCILAEEEISGEVKALGGLSELTGLSAAADGDHVVKVPLMILDDKSFLAYAEQAGGRPGLSGVIVVNRIWDSIHSSFRYREYVPYIREDLEQLRLKVPGEERAFTEIPVLGFAQAPPLLREEYEDYGLVQILPQSLWQELYGQLDTPDSDRHLYIRILAEEGAEIEALEQNAVDALEGTYESESENRIREKITNEEMIRGYRLVTGSFCALLAVIGIVSMFANAMGFLRQRKREFARYLSVGLTPEGMKKIFCIEALVIAGRPLLITLILTMIVTGVMIKASDLDPAEFLVKAPLGPILLFALTIAGSVSLAYGIGGRKLLQTSLAETLRDDTMM